MSKDTFHRAQGCLMGQLVGDSLGSLVEFKTSEEIRHLYPNGVRDLADGGVWQTIAGQPTDDSEMALALARTLVAQQAFDPEKIRAAYCDWFHSNSFGCGRTVTKALRDDCLISESQANGALMRVSPLGIFCAREGTKPEELAAWAEQEAALTHIHPLCRQANILFVAAIAQAVRQETKPVFLYQTLLEHARALSVEPELLTALIEAAHQPPRDYLQHQGWVLIAFQNAIWQLLNAPNLEEGIINTVMQGGDTDTNAAITGALLGAVYGIEAIPERWKVMILNCRPAVGRAHVVHPRPQHFWPVDALALAVQLVLPPAFSRALRPGMP